MAKSAETLFLDNLELVYENDALWLEFRRAIGSCMETRLWDERLFRRLERERLRLVSAIKSGEVVLPQKLYRLMAEKLKETPVPNESRVRKTKNFEQ
ncbi:MAG: hypothetical protein KBS54_07200 [Synergistaceae bacterium]|nr:hypothetical protein [Candidatus Equadaptatus faecalis]